MSEQPDRAGGVDSKWDSGGTHEPRQVRWRGERVPSVSEGSTPDVRESE